MSNWKLPRKRKKAFIARYGRAAYKALRYIDGTRREGVLSLRHESGRRFDISADFGTMRPVAVIGEQVGDQFHVLGAFNLSEGRVHVEEGARRMGKTAKQAARNFAQYLVSRASNLPGSMDLYMVPSAWLQVPKLVEAYKAKRLKEEMGIGLYEELLPLASEHRAAKERGDTLRALEVQQEIIGRIEREAPRTGPFTPAACTILVDRTPVAIDDYMVGAIWLTIADRHVGHDELPGGVVVSTVFLEIDHGIHHGEHLWFETLVFGGEYDGQLERYTTWVQAEEGHRRWVEKHFEV